MKNHTEIIAKYMSGELSEIDKTAFEKELATNPDLKKEYELQLNVVKGVKRMGLKNQVSSSFKKTKTHNVIKKGVIGLTVTLAVLGAVLLVKNIVNKPTNHVLYELNEQGTTNWAEADKKLESQLFKLNPTRDTIIETQQGIVISIPAESFLNSSGRATGYTVDLEIKEAMTPLEIMTARLSTMSNAKLLETGGMFYINARDGKENLIIDKSKPLNVNIPVNNNKNDMMLFKGERKADGSINWVDPKPMKKKLATVDILKLNFYPEHFLDSLKGLGFDYKNKKLTDSIYYSFSGYDTEPVQSPPPIPVESSEEGSITTSKYFGYGVSIKDGETLFRQNCAVCHSTGTEKLTGPGLSGLLNRVPKGDWLERYILNNERLIKEGDPYANKIYNENGKAAMTVFEGQLNSKDINAIVQYITGKEEMVIDDEMINHLDWEGGNDEINPARIRAIWDERFNNTILATKEFEERLKVIFSTCDARILNLYIKNLTKDLYKIDSTAATLLSGEAKNKFLEFYSRKDGGVGISNVQSQKLQLYFEEKRAVYAKAVNSALEKMYKEENKKAQIASEEYMKHMDNESLRNSMVFSEELELNMSEAYRQLGKEKPATVPSNNYVSAPITQTGWNNVDRYVMESTTNRTTLDYTDPESGKKAVIKYEPITITINNFNDYDKVMSYMIPDKLSSFRLMKNDGNKFKENLNELINYSIITIGFKGNSTYYNEIKNSKAKEYTINLTSIKTDELDKKLNRSFPLNQQADLTKDIDYQLFEIKEAARQQKIKGREVIRGRLYPVVFPCSLPVRESDSLIYETRIPAK